jgi:4'-phosphopantetheinyl transferase
MSHTGTAWDPPPAALELPDGEVHAWRIELDRGAEAVERLSATLSPDERARADRFRFARDRDRFIVGRGSLRAILGQYAGREPSAIAFRYGGWGKPELDGAPDEAGLQFNLSHTGGLALLAVARGRRLGIDVEAVRPMADAAPIAARFFSPAECAVFQRLPEPEQLAAFFRCWTRKEAYMKATGAGMSMPLDQFDVTLAPGDPPALLRVEGRPDEPSRWSYRDLDPGPGYLAALAVEGSGWRLRRFDLS